MKLLPNVIVLLSLVFSWSLFGQTPTPPSSVSKGTKELVGVFDMMWSGDTQYNTEANKYAVAAAQNGDIPGMQYAINLGFDVNSYNRTVSPPVIVIAEHYNRMDMIKFLLKNGIDVNLSGNKQAIVEATIKGRSEIVKLLADACMPTDFPDPYEHHRTSNVGALAKQYGHFDIAKWYSEWISNGSVCSVRETQELKK